MNILGQGIVGINQMIAFEEYKNREELRRFMAMQGLNPFPSQFQNRAVAAPQQDDSTLLLLTED